MSEDQKETPSSPMPPKNIDGSPEIPGMNDAANIKKDATVNLFEDHIMQEKKEAT